LDERQVCSESSLAFALSLSASLLPSSLLHSKAPPCAASVWASGRGWRLGDSPGSQALLPALQSRSPVQAHTGPTCQLPSGIEGLLWLP